jgi:hypothetical protein
MHPSEAKKRIEQLRAQLKKLHARRKQSSADKLAIMYANQELAKLEGWLRAGAPP